MKQKTPHIGDEARAQIAETLPMALNKAIQSYQDFIDDQSDEDNSSIYKNKQTAAKAGLAHIELLMKLASMVDVLDNNQTETLNNLLNHAKTELKGHNE